MIAHRTVRRTGRLDRAPSGGRDAVATTHPSLAAQVRRQIEAQYPYAVCDECLAALLLATLDEVLPASRVVASAEGFMRRVRVCNTCRRTVELTSRD